MQHAEEVDTLFRFATEGILIVDQHGFIIRVNPSAQSLFGYAENELIGQQIEILIPQRFRESHREHRRGGAASLHTRTMASGIDLYGLRKDGTELPVEISLSPYKIDNVQFVIAFIVDNTVRKQVENKLRDYSAELEEQVEQRTAGLQQAIEELEQTKTELFHALGKERDLNELKSRFVSMASHEFRTPLTTMLTSLYLLTTSGTLNEDQNRYAEKIKKSIDNLTDILNDFLSLSKLEEGQIQHQPVPVNIRKTIEEIISEMEEFTVNSHEIIYQSNGTGEVDIDPKLLKNVLFNLISNAIKFSPGDRPVLITSAILPDELHISVEDKGIGITREDRKHLFERFFRGKNATHIQGTGLGLNLVAKYTELMSGTINIESSKLKGTRFILIFPRKHILS